MANRNILPLDSDAREKALQLAQGVGDECLARGIRAILAAQPAAGSVEEMVAGAAVFVVAALLLNRPQTPLQDGHRLPPHRLSSAVARAMPSSAPLFVPSPAEPGPGLYRSPMCTAGSGSVLGDPLAASALSGARASPREPRS